MKVEDKEQNREEYLKDVDIFVTNRCNSNCIMCPLSETVRRKSDNGRIEEIFQQIKELPENVEYVNVTGGEPTLVGQAFFEIMDKLKMKFQNSGFQLLTNGRSAADFDFLYSYCHIYHTEFAGQFHYMHQMQCYMIRLQGQKEVLSKQIKE